MSTLREQNRKRMFREISDGCEDEPLIKKFKVNDKWFGALYGEKMDRLALSMKERNEMVELVKKCFKLE